MSPRFSAARTPGAEVVYVSLPPGSLPRGEIATIHSARTGSTVVTAMVNGGFDPIPLAASAGETLALDIQVSGGGSPLHLVLPVPMTLRPRVVRVSPPPRKRDVPLNAPIVVVFSEPIREGTVTDGSVRLLQSGAPVSGRAVVTAGGLRAEFMPDQLLAPNTDYVLSVTTDVADLSGDALEQAVAVEFTTGSTTAVAMVYTDPAALYVVDSYPDLDGLLRALEFSAILHDDGRITGRYRIFYPEAGYHGSGSIKCFSIAGDTVWVAGILEDASVPSAIGEDIGWRAVDNGLPGSGVADQLSLGWVGLLAGGDFGTAQDFCDKRPTQDYDGPANGDEMRLHDVEVGDIVVRGTTPPPAPPPVLSGQIAFAGVLNGDSDLEPSEIYVVNADGTALRRVTQNQASEGGAAWSPDGTKIAFVKGHENDPSDIFFDRTDIYVMNADGSGITRLTYDEGGNRDPAWSPDGRRIAFARGGYRGTGEIYVMNADGSGITRLTDNPGNDNTPSWSPDGAKMVFASQRNGVDYQIYVMNADGSGVTRLTYGPGQDVWPSWSPEGRHIAFIRGGGSGGMFVVNADGSGERWLADRVTFAPAWSPDGTIIAFTCDGVDPNRAYVCVVSAHGSEVTRLISASGIGSGPAWAPNAAAAVPSFRAGGTRR